MKALSAIYRGNRTLELSQDLALAENTPVFVVMLEDDDAGMRDQLQVNAEAVFAKLWSGKEDDVWNEYL